MASALIESQFVTEMTGCEIELDIGLCTFDFTSMLYTDCRSQSGKLIRQLQKETGMSAANLIHIKI